MEYKRPEGESVDLVLFSLPSRAHSTRPPLGLMTIVSYLEKHGIRTELIDIKVRDFKILELDSPKAKEIEKQILEKIVKFNPKMAGLSAYTHEVEYVNALAHRIKKILPDVKIIAGGQHASLAPEDFAYEGSAIDFTVIGEGEETFRELAKAILDQKPSAHFETIKSIVYRTNGKEIRTPLRPLLEPLDLIPMPAYERVDMEFYAQPQPYAIRYFPLSCMFVFASRGCPARCTFCAIPSVWRYNETKKPIRFRSTKAIVDEVQILLEKYKMDAIYFYDDDFCVWKEHIIDLCKEFIRRDLKFVWGCETRVDKVDKELLIWMRKAGCIQIDFGVESGSQAMLDAVKKDIKVEKIHVAFNLCHELGIRTFANMMYNLPGETEEDVRTNQRLIQEIKPTTSSFGLMTPFPGAAIYDQYADGKEDYALYKESTWVMPKKFIVAKHTLDLDKIAAEDNIRYNPLWNQLFPLSTTGTIMKQLVQSRRKGDYLKSAVRLGRYYFFDRLPRMMSKKLSPYGNTKNKSKKESAESVTVLPASEST